MKFSERINQIDRERKNAHWCADDVRNMCIKHNYFDAGTTEEYGRLLDDVRKSAKPTEADVFLVATDIALNTSWPVKFSELRQNIEDEVLIYY